MAITLYYPESVTHKRHVLSMISTPDVFEVPQINWTTREVVFQNTPQEYIDIIQTRFDSYDPAKSELDMLAEYISDSPVEGMTPLEAFQFLTNVIDNISDLASAKNFLGQVIPVLVAFMLLAMKHVRDDDRL